MFAVIFNSNNNKGETISKTYTTPCYLEDDVFSTDGFVLHSWNTMADGSGTTYEKHQKINTDAEGEAIGGNLYAVWKIANEGQIKVKNGNTVVDISDMFNSVYKVFGKNQPYNYVTLQILKNLFNDVSNGGYWWARQQLHPGDPSHQKPDLIQRQTKILVDVYGIEGEWLFEKADEDDDTVWKITAVSQSYYMKTTTLENLLTFEPTMSGSTLTHVKFTKIDGVQRATTSLGNGRYSVQLSVEYRNRVNVYVSSEKITVYFDATQTPSIERVTGTGTAIFAFIAKYCCGYTGSNTSTKRIFADDGFIYDFTNGTYTDVQSSYTQLEIEQIKARAKLPLSGTVMGRTYDAKNVELRVDEYCSTIVAGLCALSNRYAFFDEDAYFVDYQVEVGGVKSEILQYEFTDPKTYDYATKIKIDWGGDNTVKSGYFVPELMGLSSNADQGSQYILQSQKVISESYERTIVISDSLSTISGADLKYMYRENATGSGNDFTFDTAVRNFQTSIIALNQIVNWYKPGDCIAYNMCETKQQFTYTVETYAGLVATYPAGGNDKPYTALVLGPTDFRGKVYKGSWDGSAWVWGAESDYTDESYATLERDARYKIYSVASEVKDLQNDFTLTNVPLSGIKIAYPSCMTSYFWGNPYFMDEESEFSEVSAITSDSTLDNTSDTQISDNYAAKIVVGNQSLAELSDDRNGYTGLILEKNWDAELYRLAGYNDGTLQAQFNTQGKITAGGGMVELDSSGMKTYANASDVGTDRWVAHIDTQGAFNTGNVGGVGRVKLNGSGLNIFYDKTPYSQANAINFRNVQDTSNSKITTQFYNDYQNDRIISHIKTFTDNDGTPTTLELMCEGQNVGPSGNRSVASFKSDVKLETTDISSSSGIDSLLNDTTSSASITHVNSSTTTYTYKIYSPSGPIDLSTYVKIGSSVNLSVKIDSALTGLSGTVKTYLSVQLTDGTILNTDSKSTRAFAQTFNLDLTGISYISAIYIHSTISNLLSKTKLTTYFYNLKFVIKSIPSTSAKLLLVPDAELPLQTPNSTTMGTDAVNDKHIHIGATSVLGEFTVYDKDDTSLPLIKVGNVRYVWSDYKGIELTNIGAIATDTTSDTAIIFKLETEYGFVRSTSDGLKLDDDTLTALANALKPKLGL